jgi:inorganic pyrophosphatase
MQKANRGDRDPLDICVFSERPINRTEIFLNARVIGGLPMIDGDEADDKIVAVLENDNQWEAVTEIKQLPPILVERLVHYFSTYKMVWGQEAEIQIGEPYDRSHACRVIEAAIADYLEEFGE